MTPPRTVTVLVAEDDDQDFILLGHAFKQARIENPLVRVRDGADLMDFLMRKGAYQTPADLPWPLVLLLDLRMPKKDGWEALREMKAQTRLRRLPVVVLTTSKEPDDVTQCYDLGANSYVKKPLGLENLIAFANAFKSYWLETVEFPS